MSGGLQAQTVASSVVGTVIDTSNGVIRGAEVRLIDQGTRTSRTVSTDGMGAFRFSNVSPSVYCIAVRRDGFKSWVAIDINLSSSETRDVGRITLEVGDVNEQMAVAAEATPVQTKSSEKASLVDTEQLNRIALKGRDLFGFMNLIPGVIDTANREVTSPNGLSSITINGNTSAKNFTVDGITNMDTGANGTIHYEPNMDAVQEVKVLTANYQAEFGRNSGGQITVITKSGSRDWHGTGSWNHRHEQFNANSFFNNRSNLPRTPYRFNVAGWSLGGPANIPGLSKGSKNKLFFFASQEYTRQFVNATTQYRTVPTDLERGGVFSQSYSGNGALRRIADPLTGKDFPGNVIPKNRIDSMGLAILNFLPKPNNPYGAPAPGVNSLANQYNFQDAGSSPHPRRNDVIRTDVNPTSKLHGYFRYISDTDNQTTLYQGVQWKTGIVDHPNPGHGYAASVSYLVSPSVVNDVTFGKSWNSWAYFQQNPSDVDRSKVGNIPFLFKKELTPASNHNGMHNFVPSISFGSTPSNTATIGTGTSEYFNANDIWTIQDNLSATRGSHSLKTGVYVERTFKLQPGGNTYAGVLSFAPDANNPLNSRDGYANALLGNFLSYQEATVRTVFNAAYWNVEFYAQDNWRVNRRLTLEVGMRFYHQSPQVDLNSTFAYFDPASYSKAAMSRMYVPGLAGGKRVAKDPLTGATAPASYVGLFVPGSGDPASGMKVAGANGVARESYTQNWLAAAPRFGFAYDVFANGRTAIRGGYGCFFNRLDTNQLSNMSGQAPVAYSPTVYYQGLSSIANSNGLYGPGTVNFFSGKVPFDLVRNASLGIQHMLPGNMVLDAAYVGNWGTRLPLRVNINPVARGANFEAANADPTQPGNALPANLLRKAYPGYGDINQLAFLGHTNYNSLQVSLQRRYSSGVMYGASYTWARSMGTTSFDPLVASNEARNYGRTAADRRHVMTIFYAIDLPKLGKHFQSKALAAVVDNWTLSGVTQFSTGAPFSPTCTSTAGADITGSPNATARCFVVGDSKAAGQPETFFNTAAFRLAPVGTIGNLGVNALTGPGIRNFDATLQKFIPVWGDNNGVKLQFQGYNVFNQTQFAAYAAAAQFNAAGVQTNSAFGTASSARAARILAATVRIEF